MRRGSIRAGLLAIVLLGVAVVAFAYLTASGAGTASATTGSLTAATISVPSASAGSTKVTWTGQAALPGNTAQNSVITYTVQRNGVAVASGPCSGSLPYGTTSCTDTVATGGSYAYRVVAHYRSFSATSNTASTTVQLLDHFVVSAPATSTAGTAFTVTVTAKDAANATITAYTGTVHFTSSDAQAVLPADTAFVAGDNGVHTFTSAVTLKTAGSRTISVRDTVQTTATGTATVTVNAAAAATIATSSGSGQSATIGTAFTNPLVARVTDAFGNPVSGVSVTFTAPGSGASGTFAATGTTTTAVSTNAAGLATASTFTANGTVGAYSVAATSLGTVGPATFSLSNTKASQTITFTSTAPSAAVFGGSYTVSATATSGLTVTFSSATTAVCTVSGTSVSFVGVGTCTINADQAGNANFNAAPTATQTFPVGKASQTITFTSTAPTAATVNGATYTVAATATSGLTVTFTSATTAVCTVSGSTVSFVAAGTCTINADQGGNTNYNPAPTKQQSFTVAKGNQTITFTSTAPTKAVIGGSTYTPTATATSGLTVTFTTATPAICTVTGGVVSFIAAGTCTINANQAGNTAFNAAPQVQQSFAVGAFRIATYDRTGGGSSEKYEFNGLGGTSGASITLIVCATSTFPCAAPEDTLTATVAANGSWTTNSSKPEQGGFTYYLQATQSSPALTTQVYSFVANGNGTPTAVTPVP